MKRTRRKRVTVETERVVVISHLTGVAGWCAACGTESEMLGPQEAAAVSGLSQRTIFHYIEAKGLHFTETDNGALLICISSLMKNLHRSESKASPQILKTQPEGDT